MPEIGETKGHGLSRRELAKEKNRKKNEARKRARAGATKVPKAQADQAKVLRSAFGGAFGHAPVKVYNSARLGTLAPDRKEWEESTQELYKDEQGQWDFRQVEDTNAS